MITIKQLQIMRQETPLVDLSFTIGNSLALIGESGSGKSLTLKALLGMLPKSLQLHLEIQSPYTLQAGESIGFVPQNPFTALSPLTKIKKQFFSSQARVAELFAAVGLDLTLLDRFAAELSGGQLQRVVIAMALEHRPRLVLLDEPTTALDPQTKESIVKLLRMLQSKENFAMLFVTHDIAVAQQLCEDAVVIRSGKMVEAGKMEQIIQRPKAAYTRKLIEANFATREFRQ